MKLNVKPFKWTTSLEVDEEGSVWESWEEGYELDGKVIVTMKGVDTELSLAAYERAVEEARKDRGEKE